jgi:virulence factor Mce-like protein
VRDRQNNSLMGSPILIGAVTVLVTVVAVFLSYNANQGLPFVPTYDIDAIVPDAANLVEGNEVRIGGKRVGVVKKIDAVPGRNGPSAKLALKLDKTVDPLYTGAKLAIRPRSPLGLKYVELTPDRTGKPIPPGKSLPITATKPSVDLDQVLTALDPPARRSLQLAVTGLGDGFAGRGVDVNESIAAFPPLLRHGTRVAANVADPRTNLAGLIRGAARATGELAPVAPQLGSLVAASNTTAGALASVAPELQRALEGLPPTLSTATRTLAVAQPVLTDARALVHDIAPGTRALPSTAASLHRAVVTGIPVVRRAVALSDRLDDSLAALDKLAADPFTRGALDRLLPTADTGLALLRFTLPMQTVCNYLGLWTRNTTSSISEGDASGTWFRTLVIANTNQARAQATPSPDLHHDPYGNTAAPGQEHECEAGNEPYEPGQRLGHAPGNQGTDNETTSPPAEVSGR